MPLVRYRRYIWHHAWASLRYRYAGSGIGVFWNVIDPLLQVLLYGWVLSWLLPGAATRARFGFFLCAGLFPWLAFTEGLVRGSLSLVQDAPRIRTLRVPLEVFVAGNAVSSVLSLYVVFLLLLPLALWQGHSAVHHLLWLPLLGALLQTLGFGVSLALAALRAFFLDVGEILRILLQLAMWTLPIVYPEALLPERVRALMSFHPLYPFIVSIRGVLMGTGGVVPSAWLAMVGWTVVSVLVGWAVLRNLDADVRDVL